MSQETTKKKFFQLTVFDMATIAVMTALICVVGPLSVPIGPVPIAFANLAIFLALYVLGWRNGTICVVLYILIGMANLPVFSNFSGGLGKLAGATGGYIIGYIPMALIAGYFIEKKDNRIIKIVAMVVSTIVLYTLGTIWFCAVTHNTVEAALGLCVLPFIPGDLVKILLVSFVGDMIRQALVRAGLLKHSR